MVLKEFHKIWNVRTLLLVVIVGGALFYSWVMGQMNLKHLPLFETVEVEVGTELLKRYGTQLDASELAQIQILYEQAEEKLNEVALSAYPEIRDMGFESYQELEQYCTAQDKTEEELEAFFQTKEYQLYEKMLEDSTVAWEVETCTAYQSIITKAQVEKEIEKIDTVSTLPESVQMNVGFIIQDYSRILLLVTLLLVMPYVAMENRNRVYPIAAATKTGRRLMLHQIKAMLVAVLLLVLIFNIIFYIVYQIQTPYTRFASCKAIDLWFGWTWSEYLFIRILMLDVWAIAHAMVVFFLGSFCKTIVGTVVMALPCWGMGELAGLYFFPHLFTMSYKEYPRFSSGIFGANKYFPIVTEVFVLGIGMLLLWLLYQRRKREDIVE